MLKARQLGASPADIGEALGITRQAVYNRLHALEQRAETDPEFVIPDLDTTDEIPDLETTPTRPRSTADRLGDLMEIAAFQDVLRRTYLERDSERGVDGTFRWLTEEVGEVARALRGDGDLVHEFGDVLAWLGSLANLAGVDLEEAAARYANGCPKCGAIPCRCAFVR
jgi:NTP pyrophosphatase (non-canonical NTP hydrolase)